MLLWIAAAGAALGMYSLSFSPFTVFTELADRPEPTEEDDDR